MRISSSRCACATTGARLVRGFDDRLHLRLGHLVLVDQLDDVDAGVHDLLDFRVRVGGPATPHRYSFS
jgi:hypothetical protein